MATAATTASTSAGPVLKTLYPQKRIEELIYKKNPFLGMLKKVDDFVGDGYVNISVQYGTQQGISATLSDADTNGTPNKYKRFAVSRGNMYGTGAISGELIRTSKKADGSLVRGLDQEMKGLLNQFNRALSNAMFGNGGGAIGQILAGSSVAGTTFTLADPTQAVWFEVGQNLHFSVTDGTSGAIRTVVALRSVTAVNTRTGVITMSGDLTDSYTDIAAGDYVFIAGMHGATNAVNMTGISGWVPIADPGATAFFSVDRTAHTSRLGGLRYLAGTGGPIEETIQAALAYCFQEGAMPETAIWNPVDLQQLLIQLGNKVRLEPASRMASGKVDVGYKGIKIVAPFGEIECFADPGCQKGRVYLLTMDTWELHTMGAFPGYLDEDGLTMLRTSGDSYQWRLGAFGNLACTAPGANCAVLL